MKRLLHVLVGAVGTVCFCARTLAEESGVRGIRVGTYAQEVAASFGTGEGLPGADCTDVTVTATGEVIVWTDGGAARLDGDRWVSTGDRQLPVPEKHRFVADPGLRKLLGRDAAVRDVARGPRGEVAVAAQNGLFVKGDGTWKAVFPADGSRSWAPRDVRAVVFDSRGRLWFASPQGAGCRDGEKWKLYTGDEGLPYNDFTCMAAAADGTVWFGTRRGAIRLDGETWGYRAGRRWLPHDEVRGIAVDAAGKAWFATPAGVGHIESRSMTLAEKARFYEDEIDRYHRRTPFGYVLGASLARPGDRSEWSNHDSDNDGLWTSMYGAGECYAHAAARDPAQKKRAKDRAKKVFEALQFLGTVTQSGSHPAPRGYVARTILPTSGHNPNDGGIESDRRMRATRDREWKIIEPRWPVSADGEWYWKSDTSSDELDGHFFFYALYYDLVAETAAEKKSVRDVVTALADHFIEHDFNLVDHDGKPTRWGHFGPRDLNDNVVWWEERGLNSLSVLAYLKVAEHVSGDKKYATAARELIDDHHYAMNILYPKNQTGPGTGNQSDDEMAFMGFYNILKYEKDPELRKIYAYAFSRYWALERNELNPLFNFMYAAVTRGDQWSDPWGTQDLSPRGEWLEESIDTLKRFPMDLVDWRMSNSHRLDIVPLGRSRFGRRTGHHGRDGKVLPVDERYFDHWSHDPYQLDSGGGGGGLADGATFTLPYHMGRYHGFIED